MHIHEDHSGSISRQVALTKAADERYWLAAADASFPGIGHVRNNEGIFAWHPVIYRIDGKAE